MAFSIFIPPIEGYSEMMDLLTNMPLLQERLANLKTVQDEVDRRMSVYKDLENIQAQRDAATTLREEAKETLALAQAQADDLRKSMLSEQAVVKAKIDADWEEYQRRMKDVGDREAAAERREKQLEAFAQDLSARSLAADKRFKEGLEKQEAANQLIRDMQRRFNQTQEVWK